jgi:hypothetical protein
MVAAEPIDPAQQPRHGTAGWEAEAGYAAAARIVGPVPARGSRPEEPPLPDPPPAITGLEALMPGGDAGLALPMALAALRPDVRRWLGDERLARMATGLGMTEKALLALLGAAPKPPASLGEASLWSGQRVPLRNSTGMSWVELFWRPDRDRPAQPVPAAQAARGAFAIRLSLPGTGRIELRGRLEDARLDAVMETAEALPRATTAEVAEAFDAVLHRLKLAGSLTVRHTEQDRRT